MTLSDRAPAPGRVLVVDDSSLVRLYCRNSLEGVGFEVEQAINGLEAMEKMLAGSFELAIVDVNMPAMDGLSFVRKLRRTAGIASVPVLIVSTEAGEQDAADARAAGANFYLVKPVAEADLLQIVQILTGVAR
jgi:two-component system chemotaxis response regulator CheY